MPSGLYVSIIAPFWLVISTPTIWPSQMYWMLFMLMGYAKMNIKWKYLNIWWVYWLIHAPWWQNCYFLKADCLDMVLFLFTGLWVPFHPIWLHLYAGFLLPLPLCFIAHWYTLKGELWCLTFLSYAPYWWLTRVILFRSPGWYCTYESHWWEKGLFLRCHAITNTGGVISLF